MGHEAISSGLFLDHDEEVVVEVQKEIFRAPDFPSIPGPRCRVGFGSLVACKANTSGDHRPRGGD